MNFEFLEYVSPKRSSNMSDCGESKKIKLGFDWRVNWLSVNNFRIRINCLIRFWLIKTVFMCCLFIISVVLRLFFRSTSSRWSDDNERSLNQLTGWQDTPPEKTR